MRKLILFLLITLPTVLITLNSVSAHVTINPKEAKAVAFQNFTVSVPVEKDIATIEVRLIIPEGLESVRPNVKQGWEIELKKENDKVKEILWKNGRIGKDLRDEFVFSAKTPAEEKTLQWKAYQKYEDGTVIAWDADPKVEEDHQGEKEENKPGPYSETKVVNDLGVKVDETSGLINLRNHIRENLVGYIALLLSIIPIVFGIIKNRKNQ